MRAFIAIDIPAEICERIRELLAALRRTPTDVRWSRPEGMHITLKFLGEIPLEKVAAVKARLGTIHHPAPLAIQIQGAGFFPNERAPRVIWLGIEAGAALPALAAEIDQSLLPLGIPKENRPFSGHLTLGRVRTVDGFTSLREILRQREPLEMGSFTATEFCLYESKLAPGGSLYSKVARYPLPTGLLRDSGQG